MKKLLLVLALSVSSSAPSSHARDAFSVLTTAVVRDQDQDLVEKTVELTDLYSPDRFEGRYFKIVRKLDNEPIQIRPNDPLSVRAATAYHHLSIAHEYFQKQTDIVQPHLDEQIVVRLEMDRQFSQFIHFRNSDSNPDFSLFNLSMTVPASNDYTDEEIAPWSTEIWFHQSVPVDRTTQLEKLGAIINSRQFKNPMLLGLATSDLLTSINLFMDDKKFDDLDLKYSALSLGLSIALTEVIPWTFEQVTHLISGKYSLDTVMIPEVIYHEYAHVALAGTLEIFEPTAVVEGFPNYFASKISGLTKLGDNASDYNHGDVPKDGKSKDGYRLDLDLSRKSVHGSFVMSLLLEIEAALGNQGPAVLKRSLKYLGPTSTIKAGLATALIKAIRDVSKTDRERKALRAALNAVVLKRSL